MTVQRALRAALHGAVDKAAPTWVPLVQTAGGVAAPGVRDPRGWARGAADHEGPEDLVDMVGPIALALAAPAVECDHVPTVVRRYWADPADRFAAPSES